ncbi:MAG: pyridoxal 5'-phosphate synthase glutaminase subunit PdxT [Candidatus Peregrinibacteria bacterium]|nr:pyridoxal 5'-phosphate synthase glutaminase subunit PdxT [Candidatus Peregrinibacteria bacterium]
MDKTVGILAYQGNIKVHEAALERAGAKARRVLNPEDLHGLKHLIIPGGESTVIGKRLRESELANFIRAENEAGRLALFGTCAGAILLSQLGLIELEVERNAYGSQLDSFEAEIELKEPKRQVSATFIRAPKFHRAGPTVQVLAEYEGSPVLVKEGLVLASAFHPEYLDEPRVHEYFLGMIE